MSTKVNGETSERLGQSAKRSATVREQAGMGAFCRPGRRHNQSSFPFAFCGPTFLDLKVLGQSFLVHLEPA